MARVATLIAAVALLASALAGCQEPPDGRARIVLRQLLDDLARDRLDSACRLVAADSRRFLARAYHRSCPTALAFALPAREQYAKATVGPVSVKGTTALVAMIPYTSGQSYVFLVGLRREHGKWRVVLPSALSPTRGIHG